MKVKYICDECGLEYETREEADRCEQYHVKEREEKAKKENDMKARSKKIVELINSYLEDYNTIPDLDGLEIPDSWVDVFDDFLEED